MSSKAAGLLALTLAACGAEDEGGTNGAPELPWHFTDATRGSGLDLVLTAGGATPRQIVEVKGGGLALLDHDGDGDLDVFAPNGATLEDPENGAGARLFANESAGEALRFRDATDETGVARAFSGWGMGVAAGDVDGDGDEDLFVAAFGPDALLRNEGGAFEAVTEEAGLGDAGWGTGSAFGDVDLDGDLDLYLVRYLSLDPRDPPPPTRFLGVEVFRGPAGLSALPDRLYRNDGRGVFEDVTAESGCARAKPSYGLGVLILDLDDDGDQDVFVGNDSMPNFLLANDGSGRFEEVALEAGVAVNTDGEAQATMGIAWGDVNDDGLADLFTTNFMSDVNTLFASTGRPLGYVDKTQVLGLGMVSRPFLGWAASFADLDQDGDLDLLAFNGHVYPEDAVRALGSTARQVPLLFERAGERFERVLADRGGPWLAEGHDDRSAVLGDLDGDLDLDVVVAERNGPVRVLLNDAARGGALLVRLFDARPGSNRRGVGARVTLEREGGSRISRWIASGGSYLAACPPEAHFGLGAAQGPFVLEVRWPDGHVQTVRGVRPGLVRVERE